MKSLPDDYDLCLKRLWALRGRLGAGKAFLHEYNSICQEQLATRIIEKVPKSEEFNKGFHFLAYHCVIRKDHDTTKVRVVFDGSARSQGEMLSFNDRLKLGENFIPPLFENILRFCLHIIAVTAGIEKAFLQVGIKTDDHDYLRFLWFDEVDKDMPTIIQYRFARLPFGLKPSPSILGATINKHINSFAEREPKVVNILKQLYVDDMSCGANTVNDAVDICKKAKDILFQGGSNLRKWNSNSQILLSELQQLEKPDCQTRDSVSPVMKDEQLYTKYSVGLPSRDSISKVLGVQWDSETDQFCIDFSHIVDLANSLPPTKRSLLKLAATIFDPLGCVSLFTVNLKILFEKFRLEDLGWDELLQGDNRDRYDKVVSDIHKLQRVLIPRGLFEANKVVRSMHIHAFSDASEKAYATSVYFRVEYETNEADVRFIAAKAKVSPIKAQSIPRLELLGACLMLDGLAQTSLSG